MSAVLQCAKATAYLVYRMFAVREGGLYATSASVHVSALDTPQQMALDHQTGNIYFVDKGNKRIRVLLGSMGPDPLGLASQSRCSIASTASIAI